MTTIPMVVCSVGSVDPTAAAGVLADLIVYEALGVRPVAVVAAVSAQNGASVRSLYPMSPRAIGDQLRSVWQQVRPAAVCIGLVPHAAGLRTVRRFLTALRPRPAIVLDPVWRASNGHELSDPSAVVELLALLRVVTLATPNVDEAQRLSGQRIKNIAQARRTALDLSAAGCAILLTGGHLPGPRCTDLLVSDGGVHVLAAPRRKRSMRGMGGLLSAAICARLAHGDDVLSACMSGRAFVRRALRSATALGKGKPQLWLPARAGIAPGRRSRQRRP
ncbi:MAG: hydroxymethylpyrimidine/phosphomethylpyrimidine kinase [Candidatus Eremiobacteraeota bacterium]|nr:hydroxymethylpyrimidine/phosphomethylpyrimidine kinase [Candidatus Eremiobacteraeota bacterium]